MNKVLKLVLISAFLVILGGCSTFMGGGQTGQRIDSANVSGITKGVTTKQDIINTFGQPSWRQISGDGTETWFYEHTNTKGWHSLGVVGFLVGMGDGLSGSIDQQSLTVSFKNNRVVEYSFSSSGGFAENERTLNDSSASAPKESSSPVAKPQKKAPPKPLATKNGISGGTQKVIVPKKLEAPAKPKPM